MNRYTVLFSDNFDREFDKLSDIHKKLVMNKVTMLENNPFYPSLRTKKLFGGRRERYESSINMDIRIIWRFDGKKIIIALDVGHHDVLKKY